MMNVSFSKRLPPSALQIHWKFFNIDDRPKFIDIQIKREKSTKLKEGTIGY